MIGDGGIGTPSEVDAAVEWVPPVPDALDLVRETETMLAIIAAQRYLRIDAMRVDALAAAPVTPRFENVVERSVRLELAAGLGTTEATAGRLMVRAEALVHRYPAALDALLGGRITQRHADEIADALDAVEPEVADALLAQAVALAESQPFGTFRRALRDAIGTARADTLPERHERALQGRRVIVTDEPDGMAFFGAFIPAVEAHAAHGRMTAKAKIIAAREGETRTLDHIRADLLCDLLIEGEPDRSPDAERGIRATVFITVPALTLLESDGPDEGAAAVAAHGPATMEGVGPIPLQRAKELIGAAEGWTRVLTHPETGMVLSVGRDRYRPPPALRRLARWRADTCMAPGCNVPAGRCELDHRVPWESGGATSLENIAPLCKGHHIVKHHGGWKVVAVPGGGGALEWTSPAGRAYLVEPKRRVPTFRPDGVAGRAAAPTGSALLAPF